MRLLVRSSYNLVSRVLHTKTEFAIMKYLNVAEKNDAAKNIAALLSRGNSTRREGLSNYNKIYEFNATVFGHPAQMVMTSVSGHLLNYEFSSSFKNWQSCNPIALFDAPIFKNCPDDYQRIKKTLEREIRSCQGLIIWTDCDREGENIGFEVIQVCTDVKPNIPVYRAKFSEITAASVFRALNNLGQPNKNVSDAVDVRQELDLRTGAAFTRLQTLRLQKVFPQKLADKLISYGSCQFPTLGFVVERYQAIQDFISEQFWKIIMNHKIKDLTVEFLWKRERLFNKNACEALLDICQENPTATVELVEAKSKNKWRPLPLDTVELEKIVSRKLRINAKDTMKIAEKLYTQGYISYPRTETNIFPKELNLSTLVEQQCQDNQWGPFAQGILNDGGPRPRQGRKSDQAHPPIHPTKYANTLTGNDKKVYEYIVRHFLACVSKDALGHETVVHVDLADEKFVAKGLHILERNYLDVYIYDKWNAKEIHEYQNGDTFTPTGLSLAEGITTAPRLLTEPDLITLMEKHGIGTDATHAEHIDKIKSREYVGLHENIYFVPGTLGMGLVEGYNNIGLEISLAKPNLRADFENDLKLICEGRKSADVVRQDQIEKYKAVFIVVMEKMRLIDQTLANRLEDQPQQIAEDQFRNQGNFKPVLKCPKCGNDMIIRNRKTGNGKYLSCTAYPNCKNVIWLPLCIENVDVLNEHCETCGPNVKKLRIKFRQNPFHGEPNPNVLCIGGCDEAVLETLNVTATSVRRSVTSNNQQNTENNHHSNRAQSNNNTRPFGNSNDNRRDDHDDRPDDGSSGGRVALPNKTNNGNQWGRSFLDFNVNNTNNGNISQSPSGNGHMNNDSNRNIVCNCNNEPILLTVKKDGPNKGRKFYKCNIGAANGGCDFFQWAQENAAANVNSNTRVNLRSNSANSRNGPQCNCNLSAAQRRVTKAGPNTGREFYCCSKPMGEGCNFFKWVDESNDNYTNNHHNDNDDDDDGGGGGGAGAVGGSSGFWNGGNTSRWTGGTGSSWKKTKRNTKKYKTKSAAATKSKSSSKIMPVKGKTVRKCGICGQEGHVRTKCPNS